MKLYRNPWIDPRVNLIDAGQIEGYLARHGWRETKSRLAPMRAFEDPQGKGIVFAPTGEEDDFLRWAIEAITQVANIEDRFAGDVLSDLLQGTRAPQNLSQGTNPAQNTPDSLPHPVER